MEKNVNLNGGKLVRICGSFKQYIMPDRKLIEVPNFIKKDRS